MVISSSKLKSVDFYRKIPRDLTEASLSGAGLSIVAALAMMFLFGMELHSYWIVSTSTSVIVDQSSDGDLLRIDFSISFPMLSCEFASVDVIDVLGTSRLNITNKVFKFPIDPHLRPTGTMFSGPVSHDINHVDEVHIENEEESAVALTAQTFDQYSHQHPILVVNFYVDWCLWSNRLKPSWEKAAKIIRQRYDPEMDGRILLAKVDCTAEADLCRRHHIQGYPSIRIFRKGSDLKDEHGHHDHESYYGDRDTNTLVKTMEELVAPIQLDSQKLALENTSANANAKVKHPAPSTGGCRIEGFVRVKKVPGDLIVGARSRSHSFDPTQMNMSHLISHFSFGGKVVGSSFSEAKQLIPELGRSHDRLSGREFINHHEVGQNVTIEHYLQVVKTEVVNSRGRKLLEEYEYTAHSSLVESIYIPVAKFHFELSPMQVLITENRKSFSHFLTNVCAIIGGIFTVAGILDSILHNTIRMIKKVELGKNF